MALYAELSSLSYGTQPWKTLIKSWYLSCCSAHHSVSTKKNRLSLFFLDAAIKANMRQHLVNLKLLMQSASQIFRVLPLCGIMTNRSMLSVCWSMLLISSLFCCCYNQCLLILAAAVAVSMPLPLFRTVSVCCWFYERYRSYVVSFFQEYLDPAAVVAKIALLLLLLLLLLISVGRSTAVAAKLLSSITADPCTAVADATDPELW